MRSDCEHEGLDSASSSEKVIDEDNHRDNEEKVNKGSTDVEAEAEQPEDNQNDDNGPKHISSSPIEFGATLKSRRHYAAFVMVRCRVESPGCPVDGKIWISALESDGKKEFICGRSYNPRGVVATKDRDPGGARIQQPHGSDRAVGGRGGGRVQCVL